MTDDNSKARRVLVWAFAAVAVIGIGGVLIALGADDGSSGSNATLSTPGASIDPRSAEGICHGDQVARFDVPVTAGARRAFTATAAAKQWAAKDEVLRTTSVADARKLVAIGAAEQPPRVVLDITEDSTGWHVRATTACLELDRAACPSAPPAPSAAGALEGVCRTVDGKAYRSRGTVGPVPR